MDDVEEIVEEITVAARFCGPPDSGNGGYVAGLLGQRLAPGAVEVTLRRPPPLDRALQLSLAGEGPGRTARLFDGAARDGAARDGDVRDGDVLVAEARAVDAPAPPLPSAPTLVEAEAMAKHFTGFHEHAFPTCFVCGPERAEGDGLRIFPGRGEGDPGSPVAAPVLFEPTMGVDGLVSPEFLWAALDCPGYFAVADPGEAAVLGRITGELHRRVRVEERLLVVGFALGREGRKLFAGTALFDADGVAIARSHQTWLRV